MELMKCRSGSVHWQSQFYIGRRDFFVNILISEISITPSLFANIISRTNQDIKDAYNLKENKRKTCQSAQRLVASIPKPPPTKAPGLQKRFYQGDASKREQCIRVFITRPTYLKFCPWKKAKPSSQCTPQEEEEAVLIFYL